MIAEDVHRQFPQLSDEYLLNFDVRLKEPDYAIGILAQISLPKECLNKLKAAAQKAAQHLGTQIDPETDIHYEYTGPITPFSL